jgi:hypothetical protein
MSIPTESNRTMLAHVVIEVPDGSTVTREAVHKWLAARLREHSSPDLALTVADIKELS